MFCPLSCLRPALLQLALSKGLNMKTYITKSKAGHYTVTIKDTRKIVLFHKRYISTIVLAREIANNFLAGA
jgi:sRNA-binding regulator protein Hfq